MRHSNTEEAVAAADTAVVAAAAAGAVVGLVWWNPGKGIVDTPCSVGTQTISFVALAEEGDEKETSLRFRMSLGMMALGVESLQKRKETLFWMKEVGERA